MQWIRISINWIWIYKWMAVWFQTQIPISWCKAETLYLASCLNTLRPTQNVRHFPDDTLKCIFLNENIWLSIKISLNFILQGTINNIPALVQIMAWRLPGDKPLFKPMMVILLTPICITRPQWVKHITSLMKAVSSDFPPQFGFLFRFDAKIINFLHSIICFIHYWGRIFGDYWYHQGWPVDCLNWCPPFVSYLCSLYPQSLRLNNSVNLSPHMKSLSVYWVPHIYIISFCLPLTTLIPMIVNFIDVSWTRVMVNAN